MDTLEIRAATKYVKTKNPNQGFFGEVYRAGLDAEVVWHNTLIMIWECTLHDCLEDIRTYMDSEGGYELAKRALELKEQEEDITDALFRAVEELLFRQPDLDMVAAGAPSHTDYLTAALRLIATRNAE